MSNDREYGMRICMYEVGLWMVAGSAAVTWVGWVWMILEAGNRDRRLAELWKKGRREVMEVWDNASIGGGVSLDVNQMVRITRIMTGLGRIIEGTDPGGKDGCEICQGRMGGEPGNENIVNGMIMCDYCNVLYDKVLDMLNTKGQV